MAGNDVRIGVGATDNASSTLDKIRDKFDQLGASKGAQSILMGVGMAAGQMAFNALGKAAQAAGDLITGSVDAARQMEVAQAKLDQALQNTGSSYAANASAIEEVSKQGVNWGFTDDAIIDGMAKLVTATGSTAKAAYAMGVAQDLARLRGVSLAEATDALTMIEGGRFRGLAKLGIVLKAGATVEEALTAVEAKAAGQREAFAATEVGAWDRVGAKWDQVKEQIGNSLLGPLTDLGNVIANNMPSWLEAFGRGWDKATTAIVQFGDAIRKTGDFFEPTTHAASQLGDGLAWLLSPIFAAHDAIASLGVPAAEATQGLADVGDASLNASRKSAEAAGLMSASALAAAATADVASQDIITGSEWISAAATKASAIVYTAMTGIGDSFKSAADAAIAAVKAEITGAYDPQITAAELVVARLALADDKKKRSAKGVTTEEKAQLDLQIINDRMHIAELEAEQLTYGTAAQQTAKITGFLTGKAHADALKSTNPQEKEAADTLDTTLRAVLLKLQKDSGAFGLNTGTAYTSGLAAGLSTTTIAFRLRKIADLMRANSPPGPESPLHGIDKWGFSAGQSYTDNMADALGNKSGITNALAGLAPAFAGGGGGGAGGGTTVIVNASYSPMLSTASPGELERASRILGPGIVRELRNRGLVPQGSY